MEEEMYSNTFDGGSGGIDPNVIFQTFFSSQGNGGFGDDEEGFSSFGGIPTFFSMGGMGGGNKGFGQRGGSIFEMFQNTGGRGNTQFTGGSFPGGSFSGGSFPGGRSQTFKTSA